MTRYVEVTQEACWKIYGDGVIVVIHDGKFATEKNGYRVSGVPGKPWTFRVEKKVST